MFKFIALLMYASLVGAQDSSRVSKNYLLFMGAGGEPNGDSTIFDRTIKNMGDFSRKGWDVNISLNGGHNKTDELISKSFPNAKNNSFTENEFERLISKFENDIKNGTVKDGDQLLIFIDSHGDLGEKSQKTHRVATTGTTPISVDRLEALATLASQKGVKLAIVDGSCYSGHTLKLKNDKVCIITAAGEKSVGNNSFTDTFSNNLFVGMNLEEVFVETLNEKDHRGTSFPMISTDEGNEVQEKIDKILRDHVKMGRFLTDYISDKIKGKSCEEVSMTEINKKISDLKNIADSIYAQDMRKDVEQLEKLIESYNQSRDELINDQSDLNSLSTAKEKICSSWSQINLKELFGMHHEKCVSYSDNDIMLIDFEKNEESMKYNLQKLKNRKRSSYQNKLEEVFNKNKGSSYKKDLEDEDKFIEIQSTVKNLNSIRELENNIIILGQAKKRKENLLKKNPQLQGRKYATFENSPLEGLAQDIAKKGRDIFSKYYKHRLQMTETKSNPCRSFNLKSK